LSHILAGWTVAMAGVSPDGSKAGHGCAVWRDGTGLVVSVAGPSIELEFEGVVRFAVDPSRRSIAILPLCDPLPDETLEHLLLDQLVPRIRAHQGDLIIHAAAVSRGAGAILLVGDSGRGKSTLSAALAQLGWTLLGDDAVSLSAEGGTVRAQSLYPSLRLLPDSIAALVGDDVPTAPTAHYTIKRRVEAGDGGPLADCRAIFLLCDPSSAATEISVQRVSPGALCMALVKESFALDPSDRLRAAERLRTLSDIADRVPGYSLDYPRDYGRLPDVGRAILDQAGLAA
jgi:hypothetical protein